MEYGLSLVSAPAVEPLTLREIKRHLNLADQFERDDHLLFHQLMPQVRQEAEGYCNRAFITQGWAMTLDSPPAEILLPRNPVQSLTGVEYEQADGDLVAVEADDLRLVADQEPAIVHVVYPKPWPSDRGHNRFTVRVEWVAGYGDTGDSVPAGLKGCLLRMIEAYYRFRGQGELPETLYWALDAYRVGDEFTQYGRGRCRGVDA